MEFLKVFEEAMKLGMTKEEFLPIWELELRTRLINGGSEELLQNMAEAHDCRVSKTKFYQQLQQVKMEFEQDLQTKIQYLINQFVEKQELQWRKLWQKYDQLQDELHILINHISNTGEAQSSSLKLFFVQEISYIQQELKKVLEGKSGEQEALLLSLGTSSQKQATFQGCHDPCDGSHDFCKSNISFGNVPLNGEMSQEDLGSAKPRSYQQKQFQKQVEDRHVTESAVVMYVDELKRKLSSKDLQVVDPDNKRKQQEEEGETHQSLPLKSNTKLDESPPCLSSDHETRTTTTTNDSSDEQSIGLSIEDTGFNAKVVCKQKKKASTLTALATSSFVNKGKEVDNNLDNKNVEKVSTVELHCSVNDDESIAGGEINDDQSIKYIPEQYAGFLITNSDYFASSNEIYMTPFYYTMSEACKVRFCVCFNEQCHLNIFFLVSNGRLDNSAKWPVSFTGSGFIHNETSETFSQIWSLSPLKCSKPEPGKEVTFKALVSLKTLRNTTPDVTYQTICEKGYAFNKILSFEWNLDVLENSIDGE